jgi:ABC-type lipoprotein release transport system permease subunit
MRKMLDRYAYSVGIGLEDFILSSLTALLIAMSAVSYHAVRAAKENPAESLRYE